MTKRRVMVVGAGAWGTALASVFARGGCQTLLWDADETLINTLATTRRHPRLNTDEPLAELVEPITDFSDAGELMCVVLVVPFQALRVAATNLSASRLNYSAIACASKGLELETLAMAHEIIADANGTKMPFAQLSGPNFALEVMRGHPAAITVAATTTELGHELAEAMHSGRFRAYITDDVVGVEVGGALKNVIAIAAGIADGLELGSNTRAALITRGLAEMARFGTARGGRLETFMGLSGMGDLVLTCTDDQSRNRQFGLALAKLGNIDKAAASVGALVEGAATARALAQKFDAIGVDLPIAIEVAAVLEGKRTPSAAVENLLARDPKNEIS